MQARKIEFADYDVTLESTRVHQVSGQFEKFTARRTIEGCLWLKQHLYANAAGHSPTELMAASELVKKFYAASAAGDTSLLLETVEWDMLKRIIGKLKGFGEVDLVMIGRILKAPEVEMEEKPE